MDVQQRQHGGRDPRQRAKPAAHTTLPHHERLDGKGYPRGISGEAISLETRIITTADIFDAITAERPYRGAMPVAKTLAIMGSEVGQAIDARCFEALQRIVDDLGLS